jgi:iron(III) transport system substrate-binding protein
MVSRLLVVALSVLLCGCAGGRKQELVVYTNEDRLFSEPILRNFERAYGITVQMVFGNGGSNLVQRLISEKDAPQADVYWADNPMDAELLKRRGVTARYFSPNAKTIPEGFKDREGHWTGFSARARVLVARRGLTEKPAGMAAFGDPRFRGKGVVTSPLNGSGAAHVAALFSTWGDERGKQVLEAAKKNETKVAPSDEKSADLVMTGTCDFAVVDSANAVARVRQYGSLEIIYPDQHEGELGVLMIPNTVMLIRGARNAENARRLIDELLSSQTERRLSFDDCAKIPLHPDVEAPPELRRIGEIRTMKVNFAAVAKKMREIQPILKAWVED